MGDFLPRSVVVLNRHAFSSVLDVNGCQPERGWLIRCRCKFLPRLAKDKSWNSCPRK